MKPVFKAKLYTFLISILIWQGIVLSVAGLNSNHYDTPFLDEYLYSVKYVTLSAIAVLAIIWLLTISASPNEEK